MFEYLRSTDSLSWTIAWQSSLFLTIGLAAVLACRKRPARAHRALLAAMLAALAAPTLTESGRRLGWGLWSTPEVVRVASTPIPEGPLASAIAPVPFVPRSPERSRPTLASPSPAPADSVTPPPSTPFAWRSAFLTAWAVASLALGMRLIVSFARGASMVGRGESVDDPAIRAHVDRAVVGLGLRVAPEVRRLAAVRCPAIWCWGRRPVLLLPEEEGASADSIDWNGVFCHELAHWSRRDHLSALAGEILVCALPWNPLAWWSRLRLAELSELACDDWVLAAGLPAADYAESLLGLAPQRQSTPALAAVSSRRGLSNRLRRILAEGRRDPTPGARWTLAVCLSTLAAVSALALAQSRPASARQAATPKNKEDQAVNKTLRGTVFGPDGKPLAGADVVWIAYRKPARFYVATPKSDTEEDRLMFLDKATTDAAGGFRVSAPFNPDDYLQAGDLNSRVVVTLAGYGFTFEHLKISTLHESLVLRVPEQVAIHGRLLAPDGTPARGVRATFSRYEDTDPAKQGLFVGYQGDREELPESWPRPETTHADGRFTIEGAPIGSYASLVFKHPDYAVDDLTVDTIPGRVLSPAIRALDIKPVEPTFTHTLKPAQPIRVLVTNKATGEPLAGMLVEVTPMARLGGERLKGRTDAEGVFHASGHPDYGAYLTKVYPTPESGYLAATRVRVDGRAKVFEIDFALDKGRMIPGRVVDHDTNQPLAGASVAYLPKRENPHRKENYDFNNPVLTDADGRFMITGLVGPGFIAVEAASDAYIRTTRRPDLHAIHVQGFIAIEVPENREPKRVKVALQKGVSLEALIVGPDGRPVDVVTAAYMGIDAALLDTWNRGREFAEGKFRIPGADPERTYRVSFVAPDKHLGAFAELKYDPAENPRVIRLQPTGVIRGRIASPVGEFSIRKAHLSVSLLLGLNREINTHQEILSSKGQYYSAILGQRHFFRHEDQPDERGEFQFDALIPGMSYCIIGGTGDRAFFESVWDLKPGEVRDLGAVELRAKIATSQ